METLAVYEEHPIGTYGLRVQEGFLWLAAQRPLANWEDGPDWQALERASCPVFCNASLREGRMSLNICLAQADLPPTLEALRGLGFTPSPPARPVSVIHLQGPHFGDRHGIAAAALSSLAQAGVELVAINAVVHSLFLVVPPRQAQAALLGLSQAFATPK